MVRKPSVLSIAGSDPSGGAGILADVVAIRDLGLHAAVAITAVTAQNTQGVRRVSLLDPTLVTAQIDAVLQDADVRAIKIGMLGNAAIVRAVAASLRSSADKVPIVLDPVLVATSGDRLTDEEALDALRTELWPLAALATPNVPEALVLAGARGEDDVERALAGLSSVPVLLTGGDREGERVLDVLLWEGRRRVWSQPRVHGGPFHGTGCTLSSAIAARLALGVSLEEAVDGGIAYVRRRLEAAVHSGLGSAILGP